MFAVLVCCLSFFLWLLSVICPSFSSLNNHGAQLCYARIQLSSCIPLTVTWIPCLHLPNSSCWGFIVLSFSVSLDHIYTEARQNEAMFLCCFASVPIPPRPVPTEDIVCQISAVHLSWSSFWPSWQKISSFIQGSLSPYLSQILLVNYHPMKRRCLNCLSCSVHLLNEFENSGFYSEGE